MNNRDVVIIQSFDTTSGSLVLYCQPAFGPPTIGGFTTPTLHGYTTKPYIAGLAATVSGTARSHGTGRRLGHALIPEARRRQTHQRSHCEHTEDSQARTRIVSSKYKRIVLSKTSVKKGHSFVVTATGFKAHQKVRIRLNNKTRWSGRADAYGIVNRTVTFKSNTKSGRRSVKVQYKSHGKWHTGISTSIKYYK